MKRIGLLMLMWGLVGVGLAKDWPQMRDEADKGLPPWIQYYDRLKGEPRLGPFCQHLSEPESLNVRLVGKWGRGPAARVTGRDTLVYLALGSEVAILNCVNAHNPIIVNEIQCRYVVDRPILKDSILYCVLQGGIEVFNIANPASPTRVKYLPITAVDMCINDTMAYTVDADSFKAYRIVAPDSFQRLGACADSGYYIAADSGFAYLCDRWGLYVIDATDPTNPHQVTILTGAQTWSVLVDSGCCYYTTAGVSPNSLRIADVSDPYHPAELGYLDGVASYDLCKLSYFVYLAGYYIVDVSTPSFPTTVGNFAPGGIGVWTRSPFSASFLAAEWDGMRVLNITDPVHPALDTLIPGGDRANDVWLDGSRAYVADRLAGTKILDISNPARPNEIGEYDTADFGNGMSGAIATGVKARDTLAFLLTPQWGLFGFRVVDVTSPDGPSLLGGHFTWNPGNAIIVRDSLAYVAEDAHFEIFSIANPLNPRLVGSCWFPQASTDVCVVDTIAYVTSLPTRVINVKDPAHPDTVGIINDGAAYGISVQDTIAFVGGSSKLDAVGVANPAHPYVISSFPLPGEDCYGIALDGSLAYVGTSSELRVFDFSDPSAMRCIGYHLAPSAVLRVCRQGDLVYAACWNAGVCVFETTSTGAIAEASPVALGPQAFELAPNPASSFVDIRLEVEQNTNTRNTVRLYDAVGRVVLDIPFVPDREKSPCSQRVDISTLPDGCYFVAVEPCGLGRVQKVIKSGERK